MYTKLTYKVLSLQTQQIHTSCRFMLHFNQGDMTKILLKGRFILINANIKVNIKPRGCFCDKRLQHKQSIAIGRYLREEVFHVVVSKMEAFKSYLLLSV